MSIPSGLGNSPTVGMKASDYQATAYAELTRRFDDVRLEWSVVRDASDALAADIAVYAPRADVAIGPFNVAPGRDGAIRVELLPNDLVTFFEAFRPNANPRCLLAIEVVYSGSSKHIMGDMLNASALGLYGIVVGSEKMMPKILRIEQYVQRIAQLDKLPRLFTNLAVLSTREFDSLLNRC